MNAFTQINLPADLAARLTMEAGAMGMDLATYLAFLAQCRSGRLDAKAQDATKFLMKNHADSLRQLAQ